MRILLVDPHWRDEKLFGPHLGIAYIATVCKKNGHDVKIMDFITPKIDNNPKSYYHYKSKFIKKILCEVIKSSIDVVGITCTYLSYPISIQIANALKKNGYNGKIVLGDPHITGMQFTDIWKNKVFEDSDGVDIIVIGEGEYTMLDIVSSKKLSNIKGICFREGGNIKCSESRGYIKDLNSLPFPEWSL